MNVRDDEFKKLIDKLDELSTKIADLTHVVVITSRKEAILKGKTKKEQIEILADLGLSKSIIALIVGTTSGAVSVRISEMKKRKAKRKS